MTYTITGATSFLGVELSKALLKAGHEVMAVCRPQSNGLQALPEGVTVVHASLSNYASLPALIPHTDVFIHLAWAGTGHDGRDNTEIQKQNITYTTEAMRAAHQMACQLFVMAGSQAEYGATTAPQREEMECAPFSEYGKAKLQVQQACSALSKELGMKYIHLRIFSLFGENDHPWTLVMSCTEKMLRNEPVPLSACTQNWNFLYVCDAAQQITRLCTHALDNKDFRHEIYNIASDDTRPLRAFVERMKELTKSQSELQFGAVQPARLVSLQPDMTKLQNTIGTPIAPTGFDAVIRIILNTEY